MASEHGNSFGDDHLLSSNQLLKLRVVDVSGDHSSHSQESIPRFRHAEGSYLRNGRIQHEFYLIGTPRDSGKPNLGEARLQVDREIPLNRLR